MAEGYLRSAQAALSASATLPSAEERRAEAAMAESLAASVEQGLWRRPLSVWQGAAPEAVWLRWLIEHGEAYECDATRTDTMIQACIMHTWPCEIGPRV
jgi:hypothetical protein